MPAPTDATSAPATPAAVDPRALSKVDRLWATAVGLAVFALLFATEGWVGIPRDESFYFHAAHEYAGWFKALLHGGQNAFSEATIQRFFNYNSEHPALMKELFGLSDWLFHENLKWLPSTTAMRLPSFVLGGITAAALFAWGRTLFGLGGGLFAALSFFLIPRNAFHARLACFDFPVCAFWLLTTYAAWRGATSKRWGWATGVLFGLGLATKHNAFFIPPVLVLHWLLFHARDAWRASPSPAGFVKAIPVAFWSMATLGPLVFLLHWPWVWHHPVDRIGFWITFHLQHVHYAWLYLGELMREPPFPLPYPYAVTAMTVPGSILVAMVLGTGDKLMKLRRLDATEGLLLLNAFASLLVITPPTVPHFGGEKHWMPSIPFLCLLGAEVVMRAASWLEARLPAQKALAGPLVAALVLAPGALGYRAIGGYGTSFYGEWVGSHGGAAALGMQRQFWSNNVTGVLPWLNQNAQPQARVFFHEVTWDSLRAYQEEGRMRRDLQPVGGPDQADIACYQWHMEFRFWEYAIWNQLQTEWPVFGLYTDEVPQVVCYQRGHRS